MDDYLIEINHNNEQIKVVIALPLNKDLFKPEVTPTLNIGDAYIDSNGKCKIYH